MGWKIPKNLTAWFMDTPIICKQRGWCIFVILWIIIYCFSGFSGEFIAPSSGHVRDQSKMNDQSNYSWGYLLNMSKVNFVTVWFDNFKYSQKLCHSIQFLKRNYFYVVKNFINVILVRYHIQTFPSYIVNLFLNNKGRVVVQLWGMVYVLT